jgi:cytochrome c oxidase assembly protein subunit 15
VIQPELKGWTLAITGLVIIQLIYGAFMAGLKAANVAPTWPDINGSIIPANALTDIAHNKISIHFIHRTLAYIIFIAIVIWWYKAKNITYSIAFNKARNVTLFLVILQVTLGVLAVINSTEISAGKFGQFEWLALAHQLIGMLLFLSMITLLYLTKRKRI